MSNDETLVAHADLHLKNLFVDITEHPIRALGTISGLQYNGEVSSVAAATYVELLLYKTITNYPNTAGHLTEVYYEINFELKAANDTADLTWKLQAKDKDGEWVDMCAEQSANNIGTSWVEKVIKGYLYIQSGITKIPYEFRLIFKSSESSTDILISFSCTWASQAPGGSGQCRAVGQAGDNLYCGINDTVYYQTGTENWVVCTGAMGQVRGFAYSDVSGSYVLYAVRNGTVIKLSGTAWSEISDTPECWCILHQGNNLYIGTAAGDVEVSTDGATWATMSYPGSGAVRVLAWFGGCLYAGSTDGKVYRYISSWVEIGTGDLSGLGISEVYALAVHNSRLYVGGLGADVAIMNVAGNAWATTGGLAGNASRVFALISYDKGALGAVLYAATGNAADVDWFDESGETDEWKNTGELSGEYQVLCLGAYSVVETIYAGSCNWGKIWKATISQTWESGEGTGRLKNTVGQETFINTKGRIV